MLKGLIDVLQITVIIPYPGTPLYREGIEKNWFRFDPKDYERFDMTEPVFKTSMNPQEVQSLCQMNYKIYLDPRYMLKHLKRINSMEDFIYTLKGVKAVIGHLRDFARPVGPEKNLENNKGQINETISNELEAPLIVHIR